MSSDDRTRALLEGLLGGSVAESPGRAGLAALPLAEPASVEQAVAVVRLAASERWALVPVGAGSRLGWSRPPERVHLLLSSARLDGVLAYEPGDGTLTARAGTPWSELVALARERHHVSPELPVPERSTLGGAIAAGASGLDRLQHGPLRHQILGLTAIHADGAVVKSGGRVVKNVTGYDLHRLWCGSHGSLCFLVEATLRLHPAPVAEALARVVLGSRDEALARARSLTRTGIQPLAVVLSARAPGWELALLFAGRAEVVEHGLLVAQEQLGPGEVLRGPAVRGARAELAGREGTPGDWSPLWFSCRPSRLAGALEGLERSAGELGLAARVVCHPLLASCAAWFTPAPGPDALGALDRALGAAGLAPRWRDVDPAFLRQRPPAPATPALALMQRLKTSLDPAGLFARTFP